MRYKEPRRPLPHRDQAGILASLLSCMHAIRQAFQQVRPGRASWRAKWPLRGSHPSPGVLSDPDRWRPAFHPRRVADCLACMHESWQASGKDIIQASQLVTSFGPLFQSLPGLTRRPPCSCMHECQPAGKKGGRTGGSHRTCFLDCLLSCMQAIRQASQNASPDSSHSIRWAVLLSCMNACLLGEPVGRVAPT